jgi:serine/threonine-protein kinase HipA
MTSNSECYVYIHLPGRVGAITAGKYRLEINRDGTKVGRFIYGRHYLAHPERVDLDPIELRVGTREFATAKMGGIFGALRDASPDYWGRKLIAKRLAVAEPSELDYLLNSPDDRAGALGFGLNPTPPAPVRWFNRTLELERLVAFADELILAENDPSASKPDDADGAQMEQLLRRGSTAMGGARPKATVEDNGHLWLAKFPQRDDPWNNPRVEHAMMALARECGLSCAETRVVTVGVKDVLLVKRFDRDPAEDGGYVRSRLISALTLLGAGETGERTRWSYLLLADELRRHTGRDANLIELYRRVCFNALITNTDDHPRNHALIARQRDWSLSPAYDLTPNPMVAQERRDLAMTFGDWGRHANRANLLSQCHRFLLSREAATRIVDEMAAAVTMNWYSVARKAGVSELDCERIRGAFVYAGFGYDLAARDADGLDGLVGRSATAR